MWPRVPRGVSEPPLICGSGTYGTLRTDAKNLVCFSAKAVSSLRALFILLSVGPTVPINSPAGYWICSKKKVCCLFFYLLQTVPQSLFGFPHYLFTLNLPEFIILLSSYRHDASFLKNACKMQAIQERGNPTSWEIKKTQKAQSQF